MNRAEAVARLRELARDVIRTSSRMLAAVEAGAAPVGVLDPEPWRVKRWYARRILAALDGGRRVNTAWLVGIARAAAGP